MHLQVLCEEFKITEVDDEHDEFVETDCEHNATWLYLGPNKWISMLVCRYHVAPYKDKPGTLTRLRPAGKIKARLHHATQ